MEIRILLVSSFVHAFFFSPLLFPPHFNHTPILSVGARLAILFLRFFPNFLARDLFSLSLFFFFVPQFNVLLIPFDPCLASAWLRLCFCGQVDHSAAECSLALSVIQDFLSSAITRPDFSAFFLLEGAVFFFWGFRIV